MDGSESHYEKEMGIFMEQISPKLESTRERMNCLSLTGFSELKSLKKPMDSVVLVVSAFATLFGVSIPSRATPEDTWKLLLKFLNDKATLPKASELDPSSLPESIVMKMRQKYMSNESFSTSGEKIRSISTACHMLFEYVCNVMEHISILERIEEKKRSLASIHEACRVGLHDRVNLIMKSPNFDVNQMDREGTTPLIIASKTGDLRIFHALLDRSPDLNAINNNGLNAVMAAIENNQTETLSVLLDRGALVRNGQENGLSPILYAAKNKLNQGIIDLLLKHDPPSMIEHIKAFSDDDARVKFIESYQFSFSQLCNSSALLWFYLIEIDSFDISGKIRSLTQQNPELADLQDAKLRPAIEVASPANKLAIKSVFLWHGRYRITETHPEHVSATCYVYKAVDEMDTSSPGRPLPVALKLMRHKAHFLKELTTRNNGFSSDFVVDTINCIPSLLDIDSWPDDTNPENTSSSEVIPTINKTAAEKMFLIVMPLADRNMFVSLKQERYAGKDFEEVRHVFRQLLDCVIHLHSKGILHGDLKTLNIVRIGHKWRLIDLDAACIIGEDCVGSKSSTAYVPPEALCPVKNPDGSLNIVVKSPRSAERYAGQIELLSASASFDVWYLGCILYQLCTEDVRPLFQGGQDDNITSYESDAENNLWVLCEWSDNVKENKLNRVVNKQARNLISQMLHRDPSKRPSLNRILHHPFVSKSKSVRLVGEEAAYDFFISYRVWSDYYHAEKLYNMLKSQGFKVWWDKECLKAGVDWKEGFCEGLVNSKCFVCILSRNAVFSEERPNCNFTKFTETSSCDNVYLEHRLALELKELGLIEKVFPVMVGDAEYRHEGDSGNAETSSAGSIPSAEFPPSSYARFDASMGSQIPDVCVLSVENDLYQHLNKQALGTPIYENRSASSVWKELMMHQGVFVQGDAENAFRTAVEAISAMIPQNIYPSARPASAHKTISSITMQIHRDVIAAKDVEILSLQQEIDLLKREILSFQSSAP